MTRCPRRQADMQIKWLSLSLSTGEFLQVLAGSFFKGVPIDHQLLRQQTWVRNRRDYVYCSNRTSPAFRQCLIWSFQWISLDNARKTHKLAMEPP